MTEYESKSMLAMERIAEREGFTAAMLGKHQKTNPYFDAGIIHNGWYVCLWYAWLRGWSIYKHKVGTFPKGIEELYVAYLPPYGCEFRAAYIARDFAKFQDEHEGPIERRTCTRIGVLPEWLKEALIERYGRSR